MSGQRIVRVSAQLIVQMLTTGEVLGPARVREGLPAGARYVRCFHSPDVYADLSLVFEWDGWPELEHPARIPEFRAVLETVHL